LKSYVPENNIMCVQIDAQIFLLFFGYACLHRWRTASPTGWTESSNRAKFAFDDEPKVCPRRVLE